MIPLIFFQVYLLPVQLVAAETLGPLPRDASCRAERELDLLAVHYLLFFGDI